MKVFYPVVSHSSGHVDGVCIFSEILWKYLASQGDVDVRKIYFSSIRDSGVFNPFMRSKIVENIKDADIIHTQDDVGFMAKKGSTPLIITSHLYPFDPVYQHYTNYKQKTYQYLFLKRYQKKSFLVADAVVTPSKWLAMSIGNDYPHLRPYVIYNGIDAETFRPLEVEYPFPGRVKLLFIGNWIRRKGADLLPQIMERLGGDFVLLHAGLRSGQGPMDMAKNIESYGSLPYSSKSLARLYNSCDIFLFPSRLEGFGLAVAEAMACGRPVVATNYSSLPELVVDGEGGFLCEMDNIEDFVERIKQLAFDATLRRRMGEFNRRRVLEMFTYQRMGEEYLRLYKSFM